MMFKIDLKDGKCAAKNIKHVLLAVGSNVC